jgi:hypothetical protein
MERCCLCKATVGALKRGGVAVARYRFVIAFFNASVASTMVGLYKVLAGTYRADRLFLFTELHRLAKS